MDRKLLLLSAGALALGLLDLPASAQVLVVDQSKIPVGAPFNNSPTENVDFGDVDLDGDWDVAMADGGDFGNDQNRLWMNQGGLQGGTIGVFVDETDARLPAVLDDSRDVEFGDIDDDGDLDLYISNTAQISNQGNRWWVNLGGEQEGALGYYRDETTSRWIGLGGPGSSIPASLVIGGTFIDWSCDCDFGDLDNDGDLDLVHSTYGGSFGGNVPTRIFLNDGTGRFEEFNPSGFQLTSQNIQNGNPGIWCEGTQQANTNDSSGLQCDIASSALDIDVGDIDGDFDLDILHGARQELPRMFANRLEGSALAPSAGGLAFRDVTTASFPPGWAFGSGHYEQEMGDLDGDGDLEVYGLNWGSDFFTLQDVTMRNRGDGTFTDRQTLAFSAPDDNEGDFLDYDLDGDLDLYVANFSGQDRLHRNDGYATTLTLTYDATAVEAFFATSLDADCADVDGDGDTDVLVAEDGFSANTFLRNTTDKMDTHAPYVPNVEQAADRTAAPGAFPLRAHVYDNAPYYVTWYADVDVDVAVDGIALPSFAAKSSQGQVFRVELPANLVGSVDYGFVATDEHGNTGSSATLSYDGSYGAAFATPYGTGKAGLAGGLPALAALSVPFAGTDLYVALSSGAADGTLAVLAFGSTQDVGGTHVPGLLLAHVGGTIVTLSGALDASGDAVWELPVPPTIPPGKTTFAQGFVLDATADGDAFASSGGLTLVAQ